MLRRDITYNLLFILLAIAEVKLANARLSQKPDAPKFLNHTLLEKLYEDSQ